ncbi:MAG TPA: CsbD family protein [Saprospiraceae bacterium]|nr:CsbD family protein [Lewinellaceae bacterium]HPG08977.1 CsbD family protein [Saprospiraceae bacterium]HPR00535.1 CsbD family protein [Saprospiraceae bacterium]HQU54898.1 CsbD family protein [Saprospiraceae bacterium]HRV87155.1 CsbD family protein [Saprospiraceae bacterium]
MELNAIKLKMEGNWDLLKGKLKEKYGELTDDELTKVDGKADQLMGLLEKKLGKSKEAVSRELQDLLN